ncbi:MAG TPA: hypothetical protein VJN89_08495 [Candidatus Acidoferrum sp.]|nr:hypothetical protein [Candidatus Acidoferrum sp.]
MSVVTRTLKKTLLLLCLALAILAAPWMVSANTEEHALPSHVPPKRSSQIKDGFGINSDLPRDPYLPWNRRWWTRMFDAGFKWIRIGQYENSSDWTSWDWVEQKRGVFAVPQQVEDYVDSLVDNGVHIQAQLLYGNAMYTSPAGKLPDISVPAPGSFHNPDRSLYSVFWPPKTPEQIAAFDRYVGWMVRHFRGRISYWALWNEQDIDYWNPVPNPEEYGRLLKSFTQAVHETDPQAKVIYGGQADPTRDFTQRALNTCQCASEIDVYAYHTYPGYGRNLHPETMDSGAYRAESPKALRDLVKNYKGIRSDLPFFDDEFNSIPSWEGSDETVQAKYVPRGVLYNWAAGVKTFTWLLTAGTDGNEYDDFGIVHGLTHHDTDFTARPVFGALQNTNALFSDTKFDPEIQVSGADIPQYLRSDYPFLAYGFRSVSGKAIVAYWLGGQSYPGNSFPQLSSGLTIKNSGIEHPVLIDVVSGEIKPVTWKKGTTDMLEALPMRDSVMAIADESYFDWPVLPETPSSLNIVSSGNALKLAWAVHEETKGIIVERQIAENSGGHEGGSWQKLARLPATATEYTDSSAPRAKSLGYRVRAFNDAGESAYSNIVRTRW